MELKQQIALEIVIFILVVWPFVFIVGGGVVDAVQDKIDALEESLNDKLEPDLQELCASVGIELFNSPNILACPPEYIYYTIAGEYNCLDEEAVRGICEERAKKTERQEWDWWSDEYSEPRYPKLRNISCKPLTIEDATGFRIMWDFCNCKPCPDQRIFTTLCCEERAYAIPPNFLKDSTMEAFLNNSVGNQITQICYDHTVFYQGREMVIEECYISGQGVTYKVLDNGN